MIASRLRTIQSKIAFLIFATVGIISTGVSWQSITSSKSQNETNATSTLDSAEVTARYFLDSASQTLEKDADIFSMLPLTVSVIDSGDPATIVDSLGPLSKQFSIDIVDCYDFYGEFIASAGISEIMADKPEVQGIVEAALEGETLCSKIIVDGALVRAIAKPIGDPSDPTGVLVAAKSYDNTLATRIAEASNVSAIIEVGGHILGQSTTQFDIQSPSPLYRYRSFSIGEIPGVGNANLYLVHSLEESEALLRDNLANLLYTNACLFLLCLIIGVVAGKYINRGLKSAVGTIDDAGNTMSQTGGTVLELSENLSTASQKTNDAVNHLTDQIGHITEIVQKNQDQTSKVNDASQVVSQQVEQGSLCIGDLRTAMDRIEKGCTSVQGIAERINQVSFQTNLLALNAAVEAARAGEAGQGFSVVAEEVRSLALHASTAADEAEQQITENIQNAEDGRRTFLKVEAAFETITQQIEEVKSAAAYIVDLCREQDTRLTPFTALLGDISQQTDENASLAQRTNSCATSLITETERLENMVGSLESLITSKSRSTETA
ncbi:MAG: methyl-accepting chemotaxis protein [Opitutales bacterium]